MFCFSVMQPVTNLAKSQFLFQKNLPPQDLSIMTLPLQYIHSYLLHLQRLEWVIKKVICIKQFLESKKFWDLKITLCRLIREKGAKLYSKKYNSWKHQSFQKIAIFKIWELVFFWGVKTSFIKLARKNQQYWPFNSYYLH